MLANEPDTYSSNLPFHQIPGWQQACQMRGATCLCQYHRVAAPIHQNAEDKWACPEKKPHHPPAETWVPRKSVIFSTPSIHYPFCSVQCLPLTVRRKCIWSRWVTLSPLKVETAHHISILARKTDPNSTNLLKSSKTKFINQVCRAVLGVSLLKR